MEERLAIIGGGAIACGLAAVAARHGEVTMLARSPDSADRARAQLDAVRAKDPDPAPPGAVAVSVDPDALAPATFVVEAITEDHGAKAALLEGLDGRLAPGAVVATTTSSLSVAALAQASGRPDRFVGLHVFNPVTRMPLVELAFPPDASADTRERAHALCAALGKTAVEVPDQPGFVVNRLLFRFLFDAVRLMEEAGLEPEVIDRCMTLGTGHPIGPIALLDFVGLDVAHAIGSSLGVEIPPRIEALVAAGALGRKTGRGLYAYE